MGKAKIVEKGKTIRKPEFKVPAWTVWLYALMSMVMIPLYYYKLAVDVTLIPKLMVLAIMLLLFVLIFLAIDKFRIPQISLLKQWPVLLWAGFTVVSVASVFVAINPQEGLFDIIKASLSLFFLIITAGLLIRSKNINPFLISAVLMAIVLSLVGLSQYFNHAFRQTELSTLYKINGLMSHKNVLSGILYMALPLLCYSILTAKLPQRIISGIAIFLSTALLILTQTRSIWIAIIAFILVSIALAYIYRRKLVPGNRTELKKNVIATGTVFLLAFIFAAFLNNHSVNNPKRVQEAQHTEKVEHIHKRVASVFDTSSPNRVKRIEIWGRTIEMFTDHPVLGVGAGNWKIHAPNYYQPNPTEYHYHNWRRPHNDFLWVLAEKGLLGFLLYVGFFVSLLVITIKTLGKNISANSKLLIILMIAGIAGYGVDALFAFPYERVDIQVFLMFFASVILWVHHTTIPAKPAVQKRHRRMFLIGTAIILVFNINAIHKMIRAEVYTNYAYAAQLSGDWNTVVYVVDLGYNRRASLDPTNNPMYWYRGNANMRLNKLNEAKEDLELALRHNPHSVPVLIDLGTVHYMMEDYQKAAELFEEGLRIYPMNRGAMRGLGMTYVVLGRYQEALELYYKSMSEQHEPNLEMLINQAYQKMTEAEVTE